MAKSGNGGGQKQGFASFKNSKASRRAPQRNTTTKRGLKNSTSGLARGGTGF